MFQPGIVKTKFFLPIISNNIILYHAGRWCRAISKFKKFVKITGLDIGEIVTFNENCTVRCVYKFNGEKFLKEEVFK